MHIPFKYGCSIEKSDHIRPKNLLRPTLSKLVMSGGVFIACCKSQPNQCFPLVVVLLGVGLFGLEPQRKSLNSQPNLKQGDQTPNFKSDSFDAGI